MKENAKAELIVNMLHLHYICNVSEHAHKHTRACVCVPTYIRRNSIFIAEDPKKKNSVNTDVHKRITEVFYPLYLLLN